MNKKSKFLSISVVMLSLIIVGVVFAAHNLYPSASPASTFHSLNDLYNLIASSTNPITKGSPDSPISTTTIPTTATTTHSTSEIYAILANMVKQENVATGTVILGTMGAYGTPNTEYATITVDSASLNPASVLGVAEGYSLNDIWDLVKNNNKVGPNLNPFPVVSSPIESMHTTSDIYDEIISLKTRLGGELSNKFSGTILGVTGTLNLVSGLIGYWSFDDPAGTTTAADLSGNFKNGVLMGPVTTDQLGKIGKAFSFSNIWTQVGSGDYYTESDPSYVNIIDPEGLFKTITKQTVSFWTNISNIPVANQGTFGFISKHQHCEDSDHSWSIAYDSIVGVNTSGWYTGCTSVKLYINGTEISSFRKYFPASPVDNYPSYVNNNSLETNTWNHIAVVYNCSNLGNNDVDLMIGRLAKEGCNANNYSLNGLMDEVAIWNRDLSSTEISQLYNGGVGMSIITP